MKNLILFFAIVLAIAGCGGNDSQSTSNDSIEQKIKLTDKDSIEYTYIIEGLEKAANGDYLLYNLEILTQTDSVIYSTLKQTFPGYILISDTIAATIGMDEIFLNLKKGDSITFESSAKIIFSGNPPAPIKEDDQIKVRLGAFEIKSRTVMEAYYNEVQEKHKKGCYDIAIDYLNSLNVKIIYLNQEGYVGGVCQGGPGQYCGRVEKFYNGKYWAYDIVVFTEKDNLGNCTVKGSNDNLN
jgi:hypothetical protein